MYFRWRPKTPPHLATFLGSSLKKGKGPVKWGEILYVPPYVHPYVCPYVPRTLWQALRPLWLDLGPLWQTLSPLLQALRPSGRPTGPLAGPLASPQAMLTGPQTPLA